MGQKNTIPHKMTVCLSCRHTGAPCRPGYEMITRLRAAIAAAGDLVDADFAISGVARMACCLRPCTVAYHATRKATYLFGDIAPEDDIDDLLAFAHTYALRDAGCDLTALDAKLCNLALTRIPSAMIVMQEDGRRLS